jgi:hypothetical protein
MQEKTRSKKIYDLSNKMLTVLLYFVCCSYSSAIAQRNNDLIGKIYRDSVLVKLADLLETKYVLPEMAGKYAEEFKKKYESGSYESYSNPKEFAEKIITDLILSWSGVKI